MVGLTDTPFKAFLIAANHPKSRAVRLEKRCSWARWNRSEQFASCIAISRSN